MEYHRKTLDRLFKNRDQRFHGDVAPGQSRSAACDHHINRRVMDPRLHGFAYKCGIIADDQSVRQTVTRRLDPLGQARARRVGFQGSSLAARTTRNPHGFEFKMLIDPGHAALSFFPPPRAVSKVLVARFDPPRTTRRYLFLPEDRIRLQVVHQKVSGFERCTSMC